MIGGPVIIARGGRTCPASTASQKESHPIAVMVIYERGDLEHRSPNHKPRGRLARRRLLGAAIPHVPTGSHKWASALQYIISQSHRLLLLLLLYTILSPTHRR